jgi:CDP-diacylglycerol--serine O-phosphatidyltransferase
MSFGDPERPAKGSERRRLDFKRLYLRRDGSRRLSLRRGRIWRPLIPKPIRALMSPADMITLLNVLCGIMAIMYSIEGGSAFKIAMVLILAGVIFDGIDGPAARKFGSSHRFGKWLDSFADAITFCIAPAFLLYNLFHIKEGDGIERVQSLLAIIGAFAIAILGILRLARFSISGYKFPDFIGMPTPAMAILSVSFCGVYFWSGQTGWMTGAWIKAIGIAIPVILIVGALAMVADIRFRRFRGMPMIVLGAATAAFIISALVGIWVPEIGMVGALVGAFISTAYLLHPLMSGNEGIWGAASRMEREFEEEGLMPETDEEEGGTAE